MKYIFLFILVPGIAWSQKNKKEQLGDEVKAQMRSYGYVNGIRLDSIDAIYGQAEITFGAAIIGGNLIKRFTFQYGQHFVTEREIRVTNKEGEVLTFSSTAGALNFFEFNGWELINIYYGVGGGGQLMFFKRKKA